MVASGLAPGSYRVTADWGSDPDVDHIITVETDCSSATFSGATTGPDYQSLVATVSIPDGTITLAGSGVLDASLSCPASVVNCS